MEITNSILIVLSNDFEIYDFCLDHNVSWNPSLNGKNNIIRIPMIRIIWIFIRNTIAQNTQNDLVRKKTK